MLTKRIFITLPLLVSACLTFGQTAQNLGMPVNSQLTDEYNPSISGNGRTMIFISNTGEDNQPELVMTTAKGGVWSRPATVPNIASKTGKIKIPTDFSLSFDASTIYYSASKFGGVGGTDIWIMEKKGNTWMPAVNPGKPINSVGNEMDPSMSSDGKYLYFVRYTDKKSPSGAPCGKIFVAEKNGNLWKEPKELPATINTGCESSPRILADNQTLIFSSARAGGKGGLDLYKSTLSEDGSWSKPEPLTIINTNKDDVYAAIPASGDFVYYTGPGKTGTDLFKMKLPDNLRPKKVLLVEGAVKDQDTQKPLSSRVVVYDIKKNKLAYIFQTNTEGAYQFALPEGSQYDFSLNANDKTHGFYSEYFNLDTLSKFKEVKVDGVLPTVKSGLKIKSSGLAFDPNTSHLVSRSSYELGRIQKILQDNPTLKAEIDVHTDIVSRDTLPSAQLTEVIVDSVEVPDTNDSLGLAKIKVAKKTYHNDLTQKQADAVASDLVKKGISRERIQAKGFGDSKPVADNSTEKNRALNKRIEIVFK